MRFAFDRRYVPKRIEDAKRNRFINESKTLVKYCEEDYIWNPAYLLVRVARIVTLLCT